MLNFIQFIDFDHLYRAIDLTGVILNGFLGGRLARHKGFDAVGFAVLAIMAALGGGMVRDVMLQNGPPVALTDKYYLIFAVGGAIIAMFWRFEGRWATRVLNLADGVVLGAWAATGTAKALTLGFAFPAAILMGMITAIGGGMIRDIASGNVPMVFGGNYLYATPAFMASIVDVIFFKLQMPRTGMISASLLAAVVILISNWRGWQLPQNWDSNLPASRRKNYKQKPKN